ncbi:MAG: transposase [Frankiaceae bacterium]|nr:transposase [Frankiaceae bacterium]
MGEVARPQARLRRYGVSFKLDPTNMQTGWFARSAGSRRWCFNQSVALIAQNHAVWQAQRDAGIDAKERVKPLSAMDLRNALKADRPEWLRELSVWVLEFAAVDAAAASNGFLSGRTRFPKFAKKGKARERWTEWGRDCRLAAGALRLPKIGEIRIAGPDPDQARLRRLIRRGRARITSVTIARHADGSWWASCKIEQQLRAPAVAAAACMPIVGVDRGIRTGAVAATADGAAVLALDSGRYLRQTSRKLARAQRTVSRRTVRGQASSRNRRKAVARVGRLHEKVAQQRKNALHAYSSALIQTHLVLVLETLSTKNLMANSRLARSIADEGWGELGRQLTYKADWAGGTVLLAPRFFPSSKTCSSCGSVKAKLALSERTYTCDRCGLVLDRDLNAAATLAAWGEHQRGTCPCDDSQARDLHPAGRSDEPARHACGGWTSDPAAQAVWSVPPDEAGTSQPLVA